MLELTLPRLLDRAVSRGIESRGNGQLEVP
jgi:hypothetical protein